MHVLFVSYDGMTDPLGQSQVIPYLSKLTEFGHSFTILSCDKPDKLIKNEGQIRKLIAPFPINWISIPYTKNPPLLAKFRDIYNLNKAAVQIIKRKQTDLVHCRMGVGMLVGLHLKKRYGIKFLNDIRGFYADERVDGGIWNLKNPIYRTIYKFFKRKETEALTLADYNVCLTHKAKADILNRKNIPHPVKIEVVPCSVDLSLFDPDSISPAVRTSLQKNMGFGENNMVFSYLGSIGGWYLTDEMLKFCSVVVQKIPHARFLFITNNDHKDVENLAMKYGISKDKIVVRFGEREEVPALLSLSDFSIFFIKPCYSKLSSSPTKHGEIMALGIPVITNSGVGDVKEIVEKYDSGYILDHFNDAEYTAIVDNIHLQKKTFDSNRIRAGAMDYYNLSTAVEVYRSVYEKLQ